MARERKYRIWDGEQMLGPFTVQTLLMAIHDPGGYPDLLILREEDAVWMEYVGLEDVDGQPIYEDDVAEVRYVGDEEPAGRGRVYFDKGQFKVWGFGSMPLDQNHLRVIGNVWEHPELLEEER